MKQIKINIPTKLSDISLRQYKAFLKIQSNETNEKILNAQMIRIFCNVEMKQVMLLKLNDVNEITKRIYDLLDSKPSLVSKFELNNIVYGFQPELDEMTFGEYIDLDRYIGDWDNIEKAMNVLYRPVLVSMADKYSIEDYNIGTHQNLVNMPLDCVLGSIFFFWNLGIDLSKVILNSSNNQNPLTEQQISEENGVGSNQSLRSLTAILNDLKISPN